MTFRQTGRWRSVGYAERGPDECWPWLGYIDRGGYGQAMHPQTGRRGSAHQIVWELLTGHTAPDRASGLELHHRCHNRRCVNPTHLEIITLQRNRQLRRIKPVVVRHGTPGAYTYHRCRCNVCRPAWWAYLQERRRPRADEHHAGVESPAE